MAEHELDFKGKLQSIVNILENDRESQTIPLHELEEYVREADALCIKLNTMYGLEMVINTDDTHPPPPLTQ